MLCPGSPGKQSCENWNLGLLAPSSRSILHFQSVGYRVEVTGEFSEAGGKAYFGRWRKKRQLVRGAPKGLLFQRRGRGREDVVVHRKSSQQACLQTSSHKRKH